MILLFYILQWILIAIFFVILLLLLLWMWTGFRAKVPFVPVPAAVLADIYKALAITQGSVVYDLGCGEGRVLFYSAQRIPQATYIGIENSPFPLLLARIRAWWFHRTMGTQIQIINQDFFQHDLSDATHIFVYLYPNVMDDLLPKFDRELKPGTRVVSASFKFTQKQPQFSIDLERSKYKLARQLHVYEF